MHSKKVLIVWEHGRNLGHLSRLLPVALALRHAGFEVIFSVADAPSAQRYFGLLEFDFVAMPRIFLESQSKSFVINHADIWLKIGFSDSARAQSCVEQWCCLFKSIKPDVVLVDNSPFALFSAYASGTPVLALGHGFEIPPYKQALPCFAPWADHACEKSQQAIAQLQISFEKLAQSFQSQAEHKSFSSFNEFFHPSRVALCTWFELDHFNRDAGYQLLGDSYTGPIWRDASTDQNPGWTAEVGLKVLCYLNLVDKRYDFLWQALTKRGVNVLVVSPFGNPEACKAARDWGIHVVEKPIPINCLVQDCDAVIGHGGMGLTSMVLHAGKPIMLLPENFEQTILSHRLCARGLAVATIRYRDKLKIGHIVERLLSDAKLQTNSLLFSSKYQKFQPSQAVENVVSKIAGLI